MTTHLFVLIDESRSMLPQKEIVLDAINEWSSMLSDGDHISAYSFNHGFKCHFDRITRSEGDITVFFQDHYEPRGTTSLYDAMYKVLQFIDKTTDDKIIFLIVTDGYDNSSRDHSRYDVHDEMKRMKRFEVVFVGSNHDAVLHGEQLGIPRRSCLKYDDDNFDVAVNATTEAIRRFKTGDSRYIYFTSDDRRRSSSSGDEI